MKKILLTIVIALSVFSIWSMYIQPKNPQESPAPSALASPSPIGRMIVTYQGVNGQTALALLKVDHAITTKSSSYGEYVDSIDGIAGGIEGRYWIVYVDGKMASVGADKLITKSNQTIDWKFETEAENGTP